MNEKVKKQYLIALPCFPGEKGFCHRTILVRAKDRNDAIDQAKHHHPNSYIGDIKEQ